MDKITYLAQLAEGLARWVPERERQDILRYYAEYFEEAGPGREAEVISELGDPWALSCRLAVEGGYVTQEQANGWTPRKKKKWPWVVIGVAAVLVFVIGSVATAASRIVGLFGQVAADYAGETTVVERMPDPVATDIITYIEDEGYSGSLEAFSSIDAEISLGNITVVAGDDYTITIEQSGGLGGYSVKWEVKNGTLKVKDGSKVDQVEVSSWDDFKNLFGMGQYAVDVTITVPDSAMLEKVSVKTGLGNVLLYSVAAIDKVTAETGMGNVECYDPRYVQKIDLESGMGDVTLGMEEMYNGVEIELESGMGNVEAGLGCKESICEYELETGMGTVAVNGDNRGSKAERKSSGPYKLDAESGMGDVTVYFYED